MRRYPAGIVTTPELRLLRYFVAVAEERHFGRAAARLNMTQPPLSRAIRQLEAELGTTLLTRRPRSVVLTAAGAVLYDEARALLRRADRIPARVADAEAAAAMLWIGALADTARWAGAALLPAFRRRHPEVAVRIREADFGDPTAGLRHRDVDVAVTRAPFADDGIEVAILRRDPVGVLLRSDDPLAGRRQVGLKELSDRRWFRQPDETDPVWRRWWNRGAVTDGSDGAPVVHTIQEALSAVLWSGCIGLAPRTDSPAEGIAVVEVSDMEPSDVVVAHRRDRLTPLVSSFVEVARRAGAQPAVDR